LVYYETPASLSRKVAVIPCPTDVVNLSTTKLGTRRFPVPPHAEFDVTNPNMPPIGYNFLHDPHLKEYLNSPLVRNRLHEKGLITRQGYVKCTIKEFNDYRQWIRKLKLDAIDQDWHLKKSDNQDVNTKSVTNNEAVQLTKQRQQRAKELFSQKKIKEEKNRQRLMRNLANKEETIDLKKRERNLKMAEQHRKRGDDFKSRLEAKQDKENTNKKIRLRILLKSKQNIEDCQNRITDLQKLRRLEKTARARELWERRQVYCQGKMEEEEYLKEKEIHTRKMSINRRESVYRKERRKSDVYMIQHHQENRDNALRHLEEAGDFLNRIQEKKEKEIEKWRMKLKNIEERERLLEYYRQKRLYDDRKGKHRKRHDETRKSIWDVDNVLLKHIMDELTDKERDELEKYGNIIEEGDEGEGEDEESKDEPPTIAETPSPEPQTPPSPAVVESQQPSLEMTEINLDTTPNESGNMLEIGLIEKQPSFVRFDRIELDETENVYFQEERHSTLALEGGPHCPMLDVPGLLIQHCKSVHEHLPVVDSVHDHQDSHEGSLETVLKITGSGATNESEEDDEEFKYSDESFCSHQSSYEILVIPSRQSHCSMDVEVSSPLESRATLIHLIDQEPVMVTAVYSSTTLSNAAHQVVKDSLKNAATQLGFNEKEIIKALDLSASSSSSIHSKGSVPFMPMVSQSVLDYSKEIAELSLVGAAISLGYDKEEISNVLGVQLASNESLVNGGDDSLSVLDDMYSVTVKGIAVTAIKQAAINLGYTEEEAESALSASVQTQESGTSIAILAAELAKTAIYNASVKLGFKTDSVQTLVNEIESRMSSVSMAISNYSLKSNPSHGEAPFVVVTHNALRNAALRLGFSETEINTKIGPEKVLRCHDPVAETRCISPVHESEYLIGKYDVFSMSSKRIRVQGDSYYECLANASEEITRTVINSAIELVTVDPQLLLKSDYTSANSMDSMYELKLERTAKTFIDKVIKKAKQIVATDDTESESRRMRKMLEKRRKMRIFALKYSMMIIGSAAKQLGYTDQSILKALEKDLSHSKSGKVTEKHPSALVKFNEVSITEAIEENSTTSYSSRGRRASIKDRLPTPLPSPQESSESVAEPGDNEEDFLPGIQQDPNKDPEGVTDKDDKENISTADSLLSTGSSVCAKERRLTPFFTDSYQKRLIVEFSKVDDKIEVLVEEDEEEEEEEEKEDDNEGDDNDESSKQLKWSKEFIQKIDSMTSTTTTKPVDVAVKNVADFSNCNESDMINQIQMQQRQQYQVMMNALPSNHQVCPLNEYPTETDFMTMVNNNNNNNAAPQADQLMGILGHNHLAPGILALYNSIQSDVLRLLSATNINLLSTQTITSGSGSPCSLQSNSSPLLGQQKNNIPQYNSASFHQQSFHNVSQISSPQPQHQQYQNIPQQTPSPTGHIKQQRIISSPSLVVQPTSPVSTPPECSSQSFIKSKTSINLIPTESTVITKNYSSSKASFHGASCKSNTIQLPAVQSPKQSRLSLRHQKSSLSRSHSKIKMTTSNNVSLPNVTQSRSVIEVQEKVMDKVTSVELQQEDSLLRQQSSVENEVVLRSPADFEKSGISLDCKNTESKLMNTNNSNNRTATSSSVTSRSNATVSFRERTASPYAFQPRQKLSIQNSTHSKTSRKSSHRASSVTKPFPDTNETPNYAKPLRRSVDIVSTTQSKNSATNTTSNINNNTHQSDNRTSNKVEGSSGTSVFDRLSKHKKIASSSSKVVKVEEDTNLMSKKSVRIEKQNVTQQSFSFIQNKPSGLDSSPSVKATAKTSSRLRTTSVSVASDPTSVKASSISHKVSVTSKSAIPSKQSIATVKKRSSRDTSKRSESKVDGGGGIPESKSTTLQNVKSKSSRKIKKRKSSKIVASSQSVTKPKQSTQNAVHKEPVTAVHKTKQSNGTETEPVDSSDQTFIKLESPMSKIQSTKSMQESDKPKDTPLEVQDIENKLKTEESESCGDTDKVSGQLEEDKTEDNLVGVVEDKSNGAAVEDMEDTKEVKLQKQDKDEDGTQVDQTVKKEDDDDVAEPETFGLKVRSTIQSISVNLSTRELGDIPEHAPLPPSDSSKTVASRRSRSTRSGFSNTVHSANSGPIVSKVSLTFEDVAQFGQQPDADSHPPATATLSKHEGPQRTSAAMDNPSTSSTHEAGGVVVGTATGGASVGSNSIVYNQSVNSMKPTVSSVKFLPSSANAAVTSKQMIVSQSARSLMSNSSSRSGYHRANNRSGRSMSKSLSVGSPRLSSESYARRYSSTTPFKESIPNVLEMEYESTKVPSINDIIHQRSSAKMAAAAGGSGGNVWVPSDSLVRSAALASENLHSPSVLPTGTATPSSKSVSGSQIFVTPATSNNFVSTPRSSARGDVAASKSKEEVDGTTEKK